MCSRSSRGKKDDTSTGVSTVPSFTSVDKHVALGLASANVPRARFLLKNTLEKGEFPHPKLKTRSKKVGNFPFYTGE
jgi:hypothetical protein